MALETLETLLAEWQRVKPRRVGLGDLRTDPALQPRALDCVGFAQADAEARRSQDHSAVLAARLRSKATDLDPLLVLRTDAGLFVLDGHHRLEAYRLAGRDTIPARVLSAEWTTAVAASKLANIGGEKMTMHQSQRTDAAWQLLAQLTRQGHIGLPVGTSQRAISDRFGIAVGTVNTMVKRLREQAIAPAAFDPGHLDPGTGWPRWQYARQRNYGAEWSPPSPGEQLEEAAAKVARVVAEAHERHGTEVLRRALGALRARGMDAGAIEEWAAFLGEAEADEAPDF